MPGRRLRGLKRRVESGVLEGVGISLRSRNLEGKFRDRIWRAALDTTTGRRAQVVWGRYFFKLPWPKRNVGEATPSADEAVRPTDQPAREAVPRGCYADATGVEEA